MNKPMDLLEIYAGLDGLMRDIGILERGIAAGLSVAEVMDMVRAAREGL